MTREDLYTGILEQEAVAIHNWLISLGITPSNEIDHTMTVHRRPFPEGTEYSLYRGDQHGKLLGTLVVSYTITNHGAKA